MGKVIFWILLVILLLVLLFVFIKYFKNIRLDYLMLFSGGIGSGKTSLSVAQTFYILRKIYFIWVKNLFSKDRKDYIVLSSFPIGKWHKKKQKRYIRVFFKKIWCYDLDLDILTLQKRVPQYEIIYIVDEFSNLASQFDYNSPIVKDNLDEFFRNFRHYHKGKAYFIAIDQCSQNIFLQVRRRASYCYNLIKFRKIPLLPLCIWEYRKILISDEVQNTIETENATKETEILKFIRFVNPFKWYDSYCMSERYKKVPLLERLKSSLSLKRNDLLKLDKITPKYYHTLEYDNINEENYLKQYEKKKK